MLRYTDYRHRMGDAAPPAACDQDLNSMTCGLSRYRVYMVRSKAWLADNRAMSNGILGTADRRTCRHDEYVDLYAPQ